MSDPKLVLVFLTGGQAVLEEDHELCWASDDDDGFRDAFSDEFLNEGDAQDILEYLVEEGLLEEDEAPLVEIEVESVTGDEVDRLEGSRNNAETEP